jgi:tryptophan 2,3-dioxygenase
VALTDYEKYVRTEELLALQKAPDALTCRDELQFQIVHWTAAQAARGHDPGYHG